MHHRSVSGNETWGRRARPVLPAPAGQPCHTVTPELRRVLICALACTPPLKLKSWRQEPMRARRAPMGRAAPHHQLAGSTAALLIAGCAHIHSARPPEGSTKLLRPQAGADVQARTQAAGLGAAAPLPDPETTCSCLHAASVALPAPAAAARAPLARLLPRSLPMARRR